MAASEAVAHVTQREAQKVQTLLRRREAHHACLGPVHRQPKVLFERPFEPRHETWPHPPREDHKIIGVPNQSRVRKLRRSVGFVEGAVEVVKVDVGQQRRNHSALRRSLPRVRRAPPPLVILLHHRAPQPQANEPQHRAVGKPPFELLHQAPVIDGVEVARQIRIVHRRPAGLQRRLHLVERLMRVPPRTEAEGAALEVRLEDRFNHQQHRRLCHAVPHRRNAQRAEPTIRLGNVDAAHRLRAIRPRPQRLRKVVEKCGHAARPRLDSIQRDTIDTRRTVICPHPPPRRLQDVAPVDTVHQGVEPKPRVLLRLATQFPAQQGDTYRQVGLGHKALGFPVRDRATIAQAAVPFVARNMREVRPLRSTGITPLPHYYEPVRLPAAAAPRLWIPMARCQHPSAPRRVSQDPSLLCRRAPSPLTPGSPMRASAHYYRIGGRLQHLRKIGRCHWFYEAESGSQSLGSCLRSRRLGATRPAALWPDRSVSRHQLPSDAAPELHAERAIHGGTKTNGDAQRLSRCQPACTPAESRRRSPRFARCKQSQSHERLAESLAGEQP